MWIEIIITIVKVLVVVLLLVRLVVLVMVVAIIILVVSNTSRSTTHTTPSSRWVSSRNYSKCNNNIGNNNISTGNTNINYNTTTATTTAYRYFHYYHYYYNDHYFYIRIMYLVMEVTAHRTIPWVARVGRTSTSKWAAPRRRNNVPRLWVLITRASRIQVDTGDQGGHTASLEGRRAQVRRLRTSAHIRPLSHKKDTDSSVDACSTPVSAVKQWQVLGIQ